MCKPEARSKISALVRKDRGAAILAAKTTTGTADKTATAQVGTTKNFRALNDSTVPRRNMTQRFEVLLVGQSGVSRGDHPAVQAGWKPETTIFRITLSDYWRTHKENAGPEGPA
jgi:hypothetical protein